jgi:hypothetical protein
MWGRLEKNQETFIVVLHELQLFAQNAMLVNGTSMLKKSKFFGG